MSKFPEEETCMLAQAKRSEANPLTGSILKKPSLVEGSGYIKNALPVKEVLCMMANAYLRRRR